MEAPILDHADVGPPPEPPPECTLAVTRLTIPLSHARVRTPSPTPHRSLLDGVAYTIPLEKGRPPPKTVPCFPQGSLSDPGILIRPASPTTPFEFPFPMAFDEAPTSFSSDLDTLRLPMDSVTRVVGLPRFFGLRGDNGSYARVTSRVNNTSTGPASGCSLSMMDGGANICVTGLLELLVDVEPIPPLPISVATKTGTISLDSCCTKKGLLPLTLDDGSVYYQPCYYCKNATETIISPDAILQASDILVHWTQEGHKDGGPGNIRFSSDSGLYAITLTLEKRDGLYYSPTDVVTVAKDPTRPGVPSINRIAAPSVPAPPTEKRGKRYYPVHRDRMTESETWMLRLGSPGEDQLDLLPGNVTGIPPGFQYHPFRFIDWKEEARIQKQAAQRSAERTIEAKRRFYMDFGFMHASTSDFSRPNKNTDRVVTSYDGFSSYLLIVDEATRFIWVFLTKSKAPPLDILDSFLARFGHEHGGSVRTDQGGELARSFAVSDPYFESIGILWNLPAPTAPPRMVRLRYTTTSSLFALGLFSMALDFPPSTGLRRCNILSTSTTGSSTPSPRRLRSRHSMDINPTSDTLSFSAHASALKFRAFDVGNWIVMISRVYSLAIQPQTTTSYTLTSTQASSSVVIMPSLTRRGTFKAPAHPRLNSCIALASPQTLHPTPRPGSSLHL